VLGFTTFLFPYSKYYSVFGNTDELEAVNLWSGGYLLACSLFAFLCYCALRNWGVERQRTLVPSVGFISLGIGSAFYLLHYSSVLLVDNTKLSKYGKDAT
jgi:hypothetical protein